MSHPGSGYDQLPDFKREHLPDIRDLIEDEVSAGHFEKGRASAWKQRGEITRNPTNIHETILKHVKPVPCGSHALDRKGNPLYVELVFRGINGNAQLIQSAVNMCESLGSTDRTLKEMIKAVGKQKTLNQVYIPADFSHPYGIFFKYLADTSHINRLKGLIINMIGGQNAIMCSACIKSYLSNVTIKKEHFLHPFHACKSISGFADGACGCCVWRGEGTCEWSIVKGYVATHANEGTPTWRLGGAATSGREDPQGYSKDQLNSQSAPRLTYNWPVLRKPGENAEEYDKRVKVVTDEIYKRLEGMDLLD
uniref:WGS project CBMI000000000 data, contig CS3069_c002733 n=1 Tax=Fusarium clavum TaxID=2594811 RepID=A0A090MH81_9HYPO|nr:unnamed protein product [Fusarium clavum]